MGFGSLVPSFFIPATVDYYASFAAAALAWITMLSLSKVLPTLSRVAIAALIFLTFFSFGRQMLDLNLSAQDLYGPVPRKAQLCRKWVHQLRGQDPPPFESQLGIRRPPLLFLGEGLVRLSTYGGLGPGVFPDLRSHSGGSRTGPARGSLHPSVEFRFWRCSLRRRLRRELKSRPRPLKRLIGHFRSLTFCKQSDLDGG